MVTWDNLDTLSSFSEPFKNRSHRSEKSNVWRERGRACEKLQYSNGRGIGVQLCCKAGG